MAQPPKTLSVTHGKSWKPVSHPLKSEETLSTAATMVLEKDRQFSFGEARELPSHRGRQTSWNGTERWHEIRQRTPGAGGTHSVWSRLEECAWCVCSYTGFSWLQSSAFTSCFSWTKSCIIKSQIIMLILFPNISIALGTNLHFQNKH